MKGIAMIFRLGCCAVGLAVLGLACTTQKQKTSTNPAGASDAAPPELEPVCAPKPNTIADGDPCACETDCLPGASCWSERDNGFPGGECVRTCSSEATCGEGTDCWQIGALCNGSCQTSNDCGNFSLCTQGRCCAPGLCNKTCNSKGDCPRGRDCIEGVCVAYCHDDPDCSEQGCNPYSGQCRPADETLGPLGVPCLDNGDCRSGLCDNIAHFCRTDCFPEAPQCPENGECVGLDTGGGSVVYTCFARCDTDEDCPDKLPCTTHVGQRACRPLILGGCERPAGSALPGAPCSCDLECRAGTCSREIESGVVGGSCYVPCDSDAECGAGARCRTLVNECATECDAEHPCAHGRFCSSEGICRIGCRADSDCLGGHCDSYSLRCWPEVDGVGLEGVCQTSSDCKSRFCSNGRCSSRCRESGLPCPEGAACVHPTEPELGLCFHRCQPGDNCGPVHTCVAFGVPEELVCFPD